MKDQKQSEKKPQNKRTIATRYSGIAFEMFFVIIAGVYGGIKLDEKLETAPLFTATLSLIGVIAAIYFVIKDFLRKK